MESADLLRGVGGKPRVKYSTKNILSSGHRDGVQLGVASRAFSPRGLTMAALPADPLYSAKARFSEAASAYWA